MLSLCRSLAESASACCSAFLHVRSKAWIEQSFLRAADRQAEKACAFCSAFLQSSLETPDTMSSCGVERQAETAFAFCSAFLQPALLAAADVNIRCEPNIPLPPLLDICYRRSMISTPGGVNVLNIESLDQPLVMPSAS